MITTLRDSLLFHNLHSPIYLLYARRASVLNLYLLEISIGSSRTIGYSTMILPRVAATLSPHRSIYPWESIVCVAIQMIQWHRC